MPTTRPVVADRARESREKLPGPQATSSTPSPGPGRAAAGRSGAPRPCPGRTRPWPRGRAPVATSARRSGSRARLHQVADQRRSRRDPLEHVEVAVGSVDAAPGSGAGGAARARRALPGRAGQCRRPARAAGSAAAARAPARARGLALAGDPLEPLDRALALDPRRVVGREILRSGARPGRGSEARSAASPRRPARGCPPR